MEQFLREHDWHHWFGSTFWSSLMVNHVCVSLKVCTSDFLCVGSLQSRFFKANNGAKSQQHFVFFSLCSWTQKKKRKKKQIYFAWRRIWEINVQSGTSAHPTFVSFWFTIFHLIYDKFRHLFIYLLFICLFVYLFLGTTLAILPGDLVTQVHKIFYTILITL